MVATTPVSVALIESRRRRSCLVGFALWVDGLAAREHRDETLDASRAGVAALGLVNPVEDRVSVLAAEASEHRFGTRLKVERGGEVCRYLDRCLACIGSIPASFASVTAASPAGCIKPSACSRWTRPTLRCDHELRARLGVNRWRNVRWSRRRTCPSIQP
jgi:hypothetical protein